MKTEIPVYLLKHVVVPFEPSVLTHTPGGGERVAAHPPRDARRRDPVRRESPRGASEP